jgi:hypothetical protein
MGEVRSLRAAPTSRRPLAVAIGLVVLLSSLASVGAAPAQAKAVPEHRRTPPATRPGEVPPALGPGVVHHLRGTYRVLTTDVADAGARTRPTGPPDLAHTHDQLTDVVEVNGRWVKVHLPRGHRLVPGQTVELSGSGAGSSFEATSYQALSAAQSVDTTDVTKTLVILAYWDAKDSVTKSKAADVVFTQGNVWWKEASYGLTSLSGTVVDWVKISDPGNCYSNGDVLMSRARSKAQALIGSLSSFERTIVYFPFCAGAAGAAGWAYVPGTSVWLNGYMDKRVSIHEQGHNYGLLHAHSYHCTSGSTPVTLGGSCSYDEYGDDYDAMGGSELVGHFNAAEKNRLGWMSSRVSTLTGSGTYTLPPLERTGSGVRALKFTVGTRTYWLEHRTATGQDKNFPAGGQGILIHLLQSGVGDGGSLLLDNQPTSSGAWGADPASLPKGATWTTPGPNPVRIAFTGTTTAGAVVKVTFDAPPATAPAAPASVTAKAGDTTALVSWGTAVDNGASLTGYVVSYVKAGTSTVLTKTVSSPAGAVRSTTLTGLANGVAYQVQVAATNSVGTGPKSVAASVTPQIQVPTVVLTSPTAGGNVLSDVLNAAATATPNTTSKMAISAVDFYLDGRYADSAWSSPYTAPIDLFDVPDGTHTLQAWATDANNRVGRSAVVSFTLKKPRPTATIVSTTTTGSVLHVTVDAQPGKPTSTISDVTLTYDNGEFAVARYSLPAGQSVLDWDTRYVPSGAHTLVASVTDSEYLSGRSAPYAIAVTHPTPQVTVTSPTDASTVWGNFTVQGTTAAGEGGTAPQYVEVFADNNAWIGSASPDPVTGAFEIPVQAYSLTPGDHTLTARVTDADGFTGTSALVPFAFALPAPTVALTSPTTGSTVYADQPDGTMLVTTVPAPAPQTASAISYVEVLLDGQSIGAAYGPDDADHPEGTWTARVPGTSLVAGAHSLMAVVHDADGYSGASLLVPVTVVVPSPTSALTAPADGSTHTATFTAAATAVPSTTSNAAVSYVEFRLDGTVIGADYDGSDGWSADIDPNQYDSRSHQLTARAVDVAGYAGPSSPRTITFNTPGPAASITAPSAGADVVVADLQTGPAVDGTVARASDDTPLSLAWLEVDGYMVDSVPTPTAGPITFHAPYVTPGARTVAIAVQDDLGRTRRSLPRTVTVLTKPSQPYVSVTGGDGVLSAQWYRPYDLGGSTVASYTLRRYAGDADTSVATPLQTVTLQAPQIDPTAAEQTYDFVGMTPGTPYQVTVTATTAAGLASDPSYPGYGTPYDATPPQPVTGLTAVGTTAGVVLSWTGSGSPDVSAQDLYVEEGSVPMLGVTPTELAPSARTRTITGLTVTSDKVLSLVTRDASSNQSSVVSVVVRAASLTLTRSLGTVTYGGATTLTVKLTQTTGGTAVGGAKVALQQRKKGTTTWAALSTLTTSSTGAAALAVKPVRNTEYRAVYAGTTGRFGRLSSTVAVLVKPKVTSAWSATSIRLGGASYLKAVVSPSHAGQVVYVQRYSSGAWRTIATLKLSTSSAISYRYVPKVKGTYSYRVSKPADSDHVATTGPTVKLAVA